MAREQLFNAPAHPEMPLFDDFMSEFNDALPTNYPLTHSLSVSELDVLIPLRAKQESINHLYSE